MAANICALIRWHLKAFRLCAFLPISLATSPRKIRIEETLWTVWGLILMILFNWISFRIFQRQSMHPIYQNDIFGFSIEFIKMFITSLSMQIYVLEPLFKKSKHRTFWKLYSQLSQSQRFMPLTQQVLEYKWFLLKFYGYSAIILLLEVATTFYAQVPIVWFFSIYYPTKYLLKMQTLHMVFSVELVKVEIQNLEKDLKLLVEYTEFGQTRATFSKFDEFIRTHIHRKQKTYEGIFEMLECFKGACGMSIMANYVKNYIQLLTSLYWVYWRSYVGELMIQDVLLITAILEIPLFLVTAKSCMNAAKYISYRVHSLKRSDDNLATSIQIQNFSLQLLHQQIKIDGLGIASMDGYMLTKAIGSITTYMIFFIQFMPKFKSKFE